MVPRGAWLIRRLAQVDRVAPLGAATRLLGKPNTRSRLALEALTGVSAQAPLPAAVRRGRRASARAVATPAPVNRAARGFKEGRTALVVVDCVGE